MLLYSFGSVLLAPLRSTPLNCWNLHSDAPILPRICSTPSLPLRCSDAPLRSAAQPSAPMLRSAPQPSAPMLRSTAQPSAPMLHSVRGRTPLRSSDAPLRSAAQPSAPMLRSSPLRNPPLRCSTPSSAAALPLRCSDAPFRSAAQPSAPMLRCSAAQSSARRLWSSTPHRCAALRSDAPLRSAALVLTFCAPMLRCWDALAQLTCSEAPHRSRALLPLLSLPVPKLHTPPVLYTASWPLSGGNTFSAPVLVSARGLCAPALFYDSPLAAFAPLRCWCLRPLRPCSHARGLCALALVLAAFAPLHGSGWHACGLSRPCALVGHPICSPIEKRSAESMNTFRACAMYGWDGATVG